MPKKKDPPIHRAPTERVASALTQPTEAVRKELERYRMALAAAMKPRTHEESVRCFQAIAHALLYRAQVHGVTPTELHQFLSSLTRFYLPHGSQLGMDPQLRKRLENGAGFPEWPPKAARAQINRYLTAIYRVTATAPVSMQIRVYWHLLMVNAERMGMTHEAVLRRLEVLDRLQREEGSPERFVPDKPPSWYEHASKRPT
jgi:hypothetical protein